MTRQFGGTIGLALAAALLGCDDTSGGRGAGGGYFSGGNGGADSQGGGANGSANGGDDGTGGGTGGDGTGTDGGAHSGGDGGDDDGGTKFDTPNGSAGELPEPMTGCAKVDFLFVIDSSLSMGDEQDNLLASFPGFIDAIQKTLMVDDFHLMVVDAGPIVALGCDGTLGAGQVHSAAGQDCGLGAQRYATQDTPNLVDAFTCMASRGYDGSPNERTMDSMVAAVTTLSGAGQCNDGFLRKDALLVVTVITDEEDDSFDGLFGDPPLDGTCAAGDADLNSGGDPASWKQSLVGAKNGDEDAVVVLGLFGDCDIGGSCPGINYDPNDPVTPYTGAEPSPRLRAFANSFNYGSVGPVCAPDYSPFFAQAVSVVDTACDNYEPPG